MKVAPVPLRDAVHKPIQALDSDGIIDPLLHLLRIYRTNLTGARFCYMVLDVSYMFRVFDMFHVLDVFDMFHVLDVLHMLGMVNLPCMMNSQRSLDLCVAGMSSAPCSVTFGNELCTHFSR